MKTIYIIFISILITSCRKNSQNQAGVCISFDDCTIHEWYAMRPLLNKYQAKVTFFISDFESLDSEKIAMLKTLQTEGHEIGSHGALHTISETYIKAHSYSAYLAKEVDSNTISMERKGFTPTAFAYPYGAKYWFTDYLLLKRFKIVRGVTPLNKEKLLEMTDEAFYDFGNRNVVSAIGIDHTPGLTAIQLQKGLKRAKAKNEVLMLYGHAPENPSDSSDYTFDIHILEYILKEVQQQHLKHYTITELVQK